MKNYHLEECTICYGYSKTNHHTMQTAQIEQLVKTLVGIYDLDNKEQQVSNAFHDVLYPDCHNPFIRWHLPEVLKVLDIINHELSDLLSYYFYEVPWLKRTDPNYDVIITENEIEYHLNTTDDLILFLKYLTEGK